MVHVRNGNTDIDGIRKAIAEAKSVTDKPTLIKVRQQEHTIVWGMKVPAGQKFGD